MFNPIIHKRKSFEFENELRAVKFMLGEFIADKTSGVGVFAEPPIKGTRIPVDIDKLLSCVYIAPYSEDWFFEVVQNVTQQYGLAVDIRKSPLDKEPYY